MHGSTFYTAVEQAQVIYPILRNMCVIKKKEDIFLLARKDDFIFTLRVRFQIENSQKKRTRSLINIDLMNFFRTSLNGILSGDVKRGE